jgi:hypothetical protein
MRTQPACCTRNQAVERLMITATQLTAQWLPYFLAHPYCISCHQPDNIMLPIEAVFLAKQLFVAMSCC